MTRAFTPAQLQEIRAATAVTLQQAAESLIAVGKPLNFNVRRVGLRGFQPVIGAGKGGGRDTAVCISALRAGAALGATNWPAVYTIASFAPPATGPTVANDFRQHLAAFLLMRGGYSWFGNGWISSQPPVWYPEWAGTSGSQWVEMIVVSAPCKIDLSHDTRTTVLRACAAWLLTSDLAADCALFRAS